MSAVSRSNALFSLGFLAAALALHLARDALVGLLTGSLPYATAVKLQQAAVWACVLVVPLRLGLGSRGFSRRFVGSAPPEALAQVRIVVCGILLASTLWEDLSSSALLPAGAIEPMGFLQLLYALPIGFERFVRSPWMLGVFDWSTAALLLLGALGLGTRWVLPLAFAGYFVLAGLLRQYAWFYHTGIVPLYLLFVLALTPCSDALALDARRRRARGQAPPVASPVYAWSRFACWVVVATAYFEAGLSKLLLGGGAWAEPANLKRIVVGDSLRIMQFDWEVGLNMVHLPDFVFAGIGWFTIVAELGFVAVLFARWARVVCPLIVIGMHLGIWLLQNILFFDLILLQAIFVEPAALRRALARLLPAARIGAAPASAPGPAAPATTRYVVLASVIPAALLAVCFQHLKFFPLSAFRMYAVPNLSRSVGYVAAYGLTQANEVREIRVDREIKALADGRAKRMLRLAFSDDPDDRRIVDELLATWGALHNQGAPPEDRLRQIVIERRRWNFEEQPDDPAHGRVTGRYVYDVGTSPN